MKDLYENGNNNMAEFGQFGLRVITGTSTAGELFVALQALEDTEFSCNLLPYKTNSTAYSGSAAELIGDTSLTSVTLLAGTIIYGRFESVVVASGKLIAYKG